MSRIRVVLIIALGACTVSAIAASGARADVYSCTFTGAAGPVTAYDNAGEAAHEAGVENIVRDVQNNEGDGLTSLGDTDDGDGRAEVGGQDGSYQFTTDVPGGGAECLFVPTGAGGTAGVYQASATSQGEYDNVVCGTGWAVDDDMPAFEVTSVTFIDPRANALSEVDYRIDFTAGHGVLDIRHVATAGGQTGSGLPEDGFVNIVPLTGNCITTDVTQFLASGAFTIVTI